MPLKTKKSAFDPAAKADGMRVLVSRFWPRGVARDKVDLYLVDLAPTKDLLFAFQAGEISWREFSSRYRKEMTGQRSALRLLRHLDAEGRTLSLLCSCADPDRCHRTLLAGLIEKAG